MQRRFNTSLKRFPRAKHARLWVSPREMIARPKMSHIERKTTERRGFTKSHPCPAQVPLLDEKTLNARQFEMVVARVEQMLAAAVQARRAELSVSGDPAPDYV